MNQEETRAHWGKGQESWNVWALETLRRKQALEDAGGWAVDWFGEGQNAETEAWLADAKVDFAGVEFASDTSFENFVFPGPALFDKAHFLGKAIFTNAHFTHVARFQGARFNGDAHLKQAKFYHIADFDDAAFGAVADFEKAEFLRETTGPLVPAARFQRTHFSARADFRSAKFTGNAEFIKTAFGGNARFDEAEFQAEANFEAAVFEGTASLVKIRFAGPAKFNQAQFRSEVRLGEAEFQNTAGFEEAQFKGKTTFRLAKLAGEANFERARFDHDARFSEVQFADTANFGSAQFGHGADFQAAAFAKPAAFQRSRFTGDVNFCDAVFSGNADFASAKFTHNVSFADAGFLGAAAFAQAIFRDRANFRNVRFLGPATFSAIRSRAAFVLAGATFRQVPSLHDAGFREPPRLDDMSIANQLSLFPVWGADVARDPRPRLLRGLKACGDPEHASRYRRLRKLASATQDRERELEFFAQELRCRRFWLDKPLGRGLTRFWIGWIYGGISDFGRSLTRPLALWTATVLMFALIYLAERRSEYFASAAGPVADSAPIFPLWPVQPGFGSILGWAGSALWWFALSIVNLFAGGGCISGDTGAGAEALFLSLKNALVIFGWESPDAARRVYACLYGYEGVPGASLLRIPLSVATTAIIENILGAGLILLFLLALRNLLRAR
jgi:Pentapeptide repeats (9 copies)